MLDWIKPFKVHRMVQDLCSRRSTGENELQFHGNIIMNSCIITYFAFQQALVPIRNNDEEVKEFDINLGVVVVLANSQKISSKASMK